MAERKTLQQVAAILRREVDLQKDVRLSMRAPSGFCDSVACIAGYVAIIENPDVDDERIKDAAEQELMRSTGSLRNLYQAVDRDHAWKLSFPGINEPDNAARAIDNYLAGDAYPWAKVFDAIRLAKERGQ